MSFPLRLLVGLALALTTQAVSAQPLTVERPLVRAVPPVADTSAAFMRLTNTAERDLKLVGARSPAAEAVELHRSEHRDGVMTMRRLAEVTIPAGGRLDLAPGGLHLMLIGLVEPLKEGDEVPITLVLADGESLAVVAPVRPVRPGGEISHPAGEHRRSGGDGHRH